MKKTFLLVLEVIILAFISCSQPSGGDGGSNSFRENDAPYIQNKPTDFGSYLGFRVCRTKVD